VLPLADASHRELRIRCVVRPDLAQAILLERLGLTLPQRLKVPSNVVATFKLTIGFKGYYIANCGSWVRRHSWRERNRVNGGTKQY
jgi:hypothetical protein